MKYLNTYKLFENSSIDKELEELRLGIIDILLPLKDDYINLKVNTHYPSYKHKPFIDIIIKGSTNKFEEFNASDYKEDFKHLFSFLESENWLIKVLNNNQSNSYIEVTENPDYLCPKCKSEDVGIPTDDSELEYECYDCNYQSSMDEFRSYTLKFETMEEFINLLDSNIYKIQIRFIKN